MTSCLSSFQWKAKLSSSSATPAERPGQKPPARTSTKRDASAEPGPHPAKPRKTIATSSTKSGDEDNDPDIELIDPLAASGDSASQTSTKIIASPKEPVHHREGASISEDLCVAMGPPSSMKIYCKDIVPDKLLEGEKIAKGFEGRVRIPGYMVNTSLA